jgi:hypothetical protein
MKSKYPGAFVTDKSKLQAANEICCVNFFVCQEPTTMVSPNRETVWLFVPIIIAS